MAAFLAVGAGLAAGAALGAGAGAAFATGGLAAGFVAGLATDLAAGFAVGLAAGFAAGLAGAFATTFAADFFGSALDGAALGAAFFGAAFLADAFAATGRAGFLLAVAFDFLLMFGCLSGAARAGESNRQEYAESLDFSRHQRLQIAFFLGRQAAFLLFGEQRVEAAPTRLFPHADNGILKLPSGAFSSGDERLGSR